MPATPARKFTILLLAGIPSCASATSAIHPYCMHAETINQRIIARFRIIVEIANRKYTFLLNDLINPDAMGIVFIFSLSYRTF
jgi:hypothetical protein